mmetsp:Transcript_46731/g.84359  ORF Transcript_46731/g.84359 Transcript_46731/m.84359 type:complete len:199 (+) Transcript_46731:138-734(+)
MAKYVDLPLNVKFLDDASVQMVESASQRNDAKLRAEVHRHCRRHLWSSLRMRALLCLVLVVGVMKVAGRSLIQQWLALGLAFEWALAVARLMRPGNRSRLGRRSALEKSWYFCGLAIAVVTLISRRYRLLAAHAVCAVLWVLASRAICNRENWAQAETVRGIAASILLLPKPPRLCCASSSSSSNLSVPATPKLGPVV